MTSDKPEDAPRMSLSHWGMFLDPLFAQRQLPKSIKPLKDDFQVPWRVDVLA